MAYHETALDAIYEDSLSDGELEDGEMADGEKMDVDALDGQSVGPQEEEEEGEFIGDESPSVAFLEEPDEKRAVSLGRFNDEQTNIESGHVKEIARRPQQKKSKSKRSRKRSKSVNVAQFVRETCTYLQEKKYPLVWAAVNNLGVDGVKNLIKEVEVIERCGGQMTIDGKRRRTPGGVMWNILRSRVQPAVYKAIMSQGNEVQKQKEKKAKESLKRNRMDVDEPINNKRQKLTGKEGDLNWSGAPGKQINQARQPLRPSKELLDVLEGPQKDNSSLPATHLQKAWLEGIKRKEDVDEAAVVQTATAGVPEKNSVPVFERLRVPVEYGDLVTDKKSAHLSLEHSAQVEETLCANGRQSPEQKG
ncbi:unnamed protein product [Calypogeia fissa]